MPSIASNGQECLTVVDSMTALVPEFVLADDRSEENDWHNQVRQDNEYYNFRKDDDPFEDEDIEAEFCSMRKGESPGVDGLTCEILIKVWENAPKHIGDFMNICQIEGTFPDP